MAVGFEVTLGHPIS